MTVELWIVRHAAAEDRGADWPDDASRPLTRKGERQARRLAQVLPSVDRVFTSPKTRAAQTAAFLADHAPAGPEPLEVLADGEAAEVPEALARALASTPHDRAPSGRLRVVCVGHEPQLSETIGLLVTPDTSGRPADVRLRKGGVARLVGSLRPGGMRLELLAAQADLRRFGADA